MDDRDDSSEFPVGTCQAMCPLVEYQARQRQKRLSVFEIPSSTHKNLPVKEYSRSAAGRETNISELRPVGILLKTINYLIDEIVDRKDHAWAIVYHFVFDRIRAIRQDLVIQRIENESAVEILEKAVRFHILAHNKLRGSSLECYDPYINDSHLQECLKRLLVLYDHNITSQNRGEFEAYYLLHNLGSHEAIQRILKLPANMKAQDCLKMALDLSLTMLVGNFVAFFRISKRLSFLACCLVQRHSLTVQCSAIAVMNTAFSNPNCKFPLTLFCEILAFGNIDAAKEFLSQFGIEVTDDNIIKFSKKSFIKPSKTPDLTLVDSEVPGTAREILQGKTPRSIKTSWMNNQSDEKACFSKTKTDAGHIEETKVMTAVLGRGRGVRHCLEGQMNPRAGRRRGRGRGRAKGRGENDPSKN